MKNGIVFDIKELTVFDGAGLNVSVFMKGCPMRCQWCHNPEGIDPSIKKYGSKLVGMQLTSDELARRLNQYADLQKVTNGFIIFSGGEPMMQAEFIVETIQKLRNRRVIIDTSGFANQDDFIRINPYVNRYYYDLKIVDPNAHRQYTGRSNDCILQNLYWLDHHHNEIILRCPLIPGITDTKDNIQQLEEVLQKCHHIIRVEFLQSNPFLSSKYKALGMTISMDESPVQQQMPDINHIGRVPVITHRIL